MRHRIFTTASFKLTLLYAAIFSLSVLGLMLLMFFLIRASLEQQIRDHIEAETTQLLGDYEDDGLDELRHDIRERLEKLAASRPLSTPNMRSTLAGPRSWASNSKHCWSANRAPAKRR